MHRERCADLLARIATSQSLYGHEDDLISGNDALVLPTEADQLTCDVYLPVSMQRSQF